MSLIFVFVLSRIHPHLSLLHSSLESQWTLTALKTAYESDILSDQSSVPRISQEEEFPGSFVAG